MTPTAIAALVLLVASVGALLALGLWLAWPPVEPPAPVTDEEWRWPR